MSRKSFTLIEVLVTISIIAVLSATVVAFLNPVEFFNQGRDAQRVADIERLNTAASLYNLKVRGPMGAENTVYTSLPDSHPDCSSYNLPNLPTGYYYHCATEANLKKIDGFGWIPIDFTSIPGGSPLSILPIDPTNDVSYYYSFMIEGRIYKFFTEMESITYGPSGNKSVTVKDGGINSFVYEVGTNLALAIPANILLNSEVDDITSGYSPGWDSALNGNYRPATGWSGGYNSGVSSPTIGYHAHANPSCGINGSGCLEYIDENCVYGYCNRWLGVTQVWSNPGVNKGWTAGTKFRVRFLAKNNTISKNAYFGLYHYSIASGTNTFSGGGGAISKPLSKSGEWTIVTAEFAATADWEMMTHNVTLYLYGHAGSGEGRLWIDGTEVVYWNP